MREFDFGPAELAPGANPTLGPVIYDNGMSDDQGLAAAQFDGAGFDPEPADDFILGTTQDIYDINWVGGYWNYQGAAPYDYALDWRITFYNDDGTGTAPGTVKYSFDVADGDLTDKTVRATYADSMYFEYGADLPSPQTFSGTTKYWVSIVGLGPSFPQCGWAKHAGVLQHQMVFRSVYFSFPNWVPGGSVFGTPGDCAFQLTGQGASGCIPNACDFNIVSINNMINGNTINSLPHTINITYRNDGDLPIYELKLLADVYEKVCGDTTEWCWPITKDLYDARYDTNNDNFTVFDDPADDLLPEGDGGDTWALQYKEFHSGGEAYRCTQGEDRGPGDVEDTYIGRSVAILDDALIWDPINQTRNDMTDAACVEFSFWHKATGEYMVDEDGNAIPIDYGHIEYSFDGMTWFSIPLSDFVAYDNEWEQWKIKFINTDANGGHYDIVCDDCKCDDECEERVICEEIDFSQYGQMNLRVKFNWHVNPCNQYEGWYIDDICFSRTEEYEKELVFQTHQIIVNIPGCTGDVFFEFPLDFDPEKDKWYYIEICGQVFDPAGCEIDLSNNCIDLQFVVSDVHDIACIGMTGPARLSKKADCCGAPDETGVYDITIKNVGTFTEDKVPVDLRMAKLHAETYIDLDMEEDPSNAFTCYYFTGYEPGCPWRWTEGDDNIPEPRSKLPGEESFIWADDGLIPMYEPGWGNYLTNDIYYDFSDAGDCEEAILEFSIKWSFDGTPEFDPWGFVSWDRARFYVQPEFGPYSNYVIGFITWAQGTWSNDWVDYAIDMKSLQLALDAQFGDPCTDEIVPFSFGWGAFSNNDAHVVPAGNPIPWSGLMLDNIKFTHTYPDPSSDIVYTAESGILEPGDEETLSLYLNETQYCNWVAIGDANLATDVNPANDTCCVKTIVASDMGAEIVPKSIDLTGGDSLWQICSSKQIDDNFYTATQDFGDYRAYLPNMDDSLISCEIDLSAHSTSGVIMTYDSYFKFFHWTDPYGLYYDNGFDWYGSSLGHNGDRGEVYARATPSDNWVLIDICDYMDYNAGMDPVWGLYTYHDWDDGSGNYLMQTSIPAGLCTDQTQIRFRFVSDDLSDIPYMAEPDESEGWYIDDIKIWDITLTGTILDENFEAAGGVFPPGPVTQWSQSIYSGTGSWEAGTSSSYDFYLKPGGASGCFIFADSNGHSSDVFDCEIFTKSMDLTGATLVTFECDGAFQDFAGDGEFQIAVYSGGTGPANLETVLYYTDVDEPIGGIHHVYLFDATTLSDITDVYIGFLYTTQGGTWAWGAGVDNVHVWDGGGDYLFEDFEANWCPSFPPTGWSVIQTSTEINGAYACYWDQMAYDYVSPVTSAGLWWATGSQDEWLISPAIPATLPGQLAELEFWTYNYGQYPGYYEEDLIKTSSDGGMSWDTLGNLHTMVPDFPGGNFFDSPVSFGLANDVTHVAFHRYSGPDNLGVWFLDDIKVNVYDKNTVQVEFDFEPTFGCKWETNATVAGDYWEYTTALPASVGSDADGDGNVWFCHDYPDTGRGLNDVLYAEVNFTEEMTYVDFTFQDAAVIEAGCAAYFEISTDFDPADPTGGTWITHWAFENDFGMTMGWSWFANNYAFSDYLDDGSVFVRWRYTTPGNGLFNKVADSGWAVDDFGLHFKQIEFVDEIAPITTLVFDEYTGTVSLFANDPAGPVVSGVKATYYILDGGSTMEYTGPITLSDGTHTVTYWSEDNAGNVEGQKTSPPLVVDATDPTVEIVEPEEGYLYLFGNKLMGRIFGSGTLCIGKVTIVAQASDTGTGVSMVTFDIDGDSGYAVSAPYEYVYNDMHFGSITVTATAFDGAGRSAEDSMTFTIYSLGLL
jgi:hypothetical protein